MSFLRFAGLVMLASLALYGCGGNGDGTGPIFSTPSSISGVSGNNQVGTVGQVLAQPIRVRVLDASGRALANVNVQFNVASGGGTITAAVADGLAGGDYGLGASLLVNVSTNSAGEAQANWMLGSASGLQTATASVSGVAPFEFTATAQPDVPASLTMNSGDDQLQQIGFPLDAPFVVRVADAFGNDVPGAPVVWQVTLGNGELIDVSSATDAGGFSIATLVPGPVAEPVEVTASLFDLPAVTFIALGFAGALDPVGDEFSTAASAGLVPPDVTTMIAWREAGELVFAMAFVEVVDPIDVGGPNVVAGFVDFDTDQDQGTGVQAIADLWRPEGEPGSSGMGTDYFIDMFTSGGYEVVDAATMTVVGTVTPEFDAEILIMILPLELIGGDDGALNICAGVATEQEPTDIAPNDGNFSTALPPSLAAVGQREEMRVLTRRAKSLVEERALLGAARTGASVRTSSEKVDYSRMRK